MEKTTINDALKLLRVKKRGFSQAVDLIVALKDIDLKKPEQQVDFFIALPNNPGKKLKICAFVDNDMAPDAKHVFDTVVLNEDFAGYAKDKKAIRKLAKAHSYFVGQMTIMPKVANTFGRVLGPKGKMPNPKAGCVVPSKTPLKPLYERLQSTVRVSAKIAPVVQCKIGSELLNDEQLIQNFNAVYEQLIRLLPNGESNVNAAFLKLTMGCPVRIK